MIYTSYFSYARHLRGTMFSIAITQPKFMRLPIIYDFAPTPMLLRDFKDGRVSEDEYIERFYNETLEHVKDSTVEMLKNLSKDKYVFLLCWEGKNKFCHRHLVAEWLSGRLGEPVEEYKDPNTKD